jgi:toxin ParE1/3/4
VKRIVWLKRALVNIEEIHRYYLEEDSAKVASSLITLILKSIQQLRKFSALGRFGKVKGTRELIIPKAQYIVVYREKNLRVEIIRVLHTTQKWPRSDLEQ